MIMKRTHILFLFAVCAMLLFASKAKAQAKAASPTLPDSIDEEVLLRGDTLHTVHRNTAQGLNARKYVLENEYVHHGETFTKRWLDHLYIEGGFAMERIAPVSSNYHYGILEGMRIAVGKELSPLSSFRLSLQAESGYQADYYYTFVKYHGGLDYLFNLSNYFAGYRSSRHLNVSAVFGLGMSHSQNRHSKESATAGDVHAGLQLKFYTGPHASFAIEPYAGIAGDQVDVSGNRNWRKYDFFYGMYVSYIYYLRNNLSPEIRRKYISPRYRRGDGDGIEPPSWWKPWFVEYCQGVAFNNSSSLSVMSSRGSSYSLAIGRWLSPTIGLRGSLFMRSTYWHQEYSNAIQHDGAMAATDYPANYAGGRLDMLVNPWGFSRHFRWSQPLTGWLVLGVEKGKLKKTQTGTPFCNWVQGLSAGLHVAGRLTDNLQLFLEPRYTWTHYHIPYNNVDWYKRYIDRGFSIEAGVSVYMLPKKYQSDETTDFFMRRLNDVRIGVLGGTNFLFRNSPVYEGCNNMGYNYGGYAEYRFSYVSGVRLAYEQVRLSYTAPTYYNDVYQDESSNQLAHSRYGLWDHKYDIGMFSLAYHMDVSAALSSSRQRPFTLEAFMGVALATKPHLSATINAGESIAKNHTALYIPVQSGKDYKVGGVVGFNLVGHLTRHMDLMLTSSNYLIHGFMPAGLDMPQLLQCSFFSTLNLSVRYNFSLKQLFKIKKEWL